jgi:hypothetical protein
MLAACGPFVQHGLPQRATCCNATWRRLLFRLQFRKALGPLQVAQRARLRGSTYFINTTTTYCTVLLRIPKRAVWRGFRPCFGFRRGRSPFRRRLGPFFGIVDRVLLWITSVAVMPWLAGVRPAPAAATAGCVRTASGLPRSP